MLPMLHTASSRPAAGRDPACSASEGSPTSTAPIPTPVSATGPSSARNSALASAGRRSSPGARKRDVRTSAERRNSDVPPRHTAPSSATAASGEVSAMISATTSGPAIHTVSWSTASSE